METETRKCEVCGEVKPLSAFSKSYKHRCKDCVAAQTKRKRQQKRIDDRWDERRYELTKIALQGILSDPKAVITCEEVADNSVDIASRIIELLKKGGSK